MSSLNNSNNLDINRGFELVLRRKPPEKKTFLLGFEKMISLFSKEISIYFKFSLDVRKSK
jgi:hypothetical protein